MCTLFTQYYYNHIFIMQNFNPRNYHIVILYAGLIASLLISTIESQRTSQLMLDIEKLTAVETGR